MNSSHDAPQNLDGQSLNAELAQNPALAEWLEAFVNADDGATLDAKDDLVLMDDDEEDNIDVWGVLNGDDYDSTYTSSGYDTSYNGDAPNPNGPPGGDGTDEDEIIVTAQINPRAAEIAASLSVVHNSDGTTTYTLEGVEFTNESEWLEAILDALIDAFADDNDGLGGTILGILVNSLLGPAAQAIFDALPADGQRWFLYDVFGIILPE